MLENGTGLQNNSKNNYLFIYFIIFIKYTNDSFEVALKSVKDDRNIGGFVQEINILKDLRHPGIVQVFGFTQVDDEFVAVLEFCKKGIFLFFELNDILVKPRKMEESR